MITIILVMFAAALNAVMDTLAHHYSTSIFKGLDKQYWDPSISWKNKYDVKGIWGMTQLSDGWHVAKTLMIVYIMLAIVSFPSAYHICIFNSVILNGIIWVGILGTAWNITFSFFYNLVLR